MSCIIVALHVPVCCVINNASIRLYQPNFEIHDVHVLLYTDRVIYSYVVWFWKKVLPIAIIRRKLSVSKLKSPSRLSTNYRNTAFWLLEAGARDADVSRSFGCNERLMYRLQSRFRQSGSKNDKPLPGRPRITTPLEVRVIVTSTWRNRFMAAWKLLKRLWHATGTRISVYTVRNRLRGASLIFEFWNLNFDERFWWRMWVYFQNVLLKMFIFIGN